jgi:hypothetical protein
MSGELDDGWHSPFIGVFNSDNQLLIFLQCLRSFFP